MRPELKISKFREWTPKFNYIKQLFQNTGAEFEKKTAWP